MVLLPISLLSIKSSSGHKTHQNYWDLSQNPEGNLAQNILPVYCTTRNIQRKIQWQLRLVEFPEYWACKGGRQPWQWLRGLFLTDSSERVSLQEGKAFKPVPYLPPVLKCKAPPELQTILHYSIKLFMFLTYLKEQKQMWSEISHQSLFADKRHHNEKIVLSISSPKSKPTLNWAAL